MYSNIQIQAFGIIKRGFLLDDELLALLERTSNGMLAVKEKYDRFHTVIIKTYHSKYEEAENSIHQLEQELEATRAKLIEE